MKNLTTKAYKGIKLLFFDQKLIPGQKILYEELAQSFNMSRTPVINALGRLEQEGFVTLEDNRGYFVSKISLKEAKESIDTRELIENYCIRRAIQNLRENYRPENIDEVERALEVYAAYRPEFYDKKRLFLDVEFHLRIAEMADNQVMVEILRQLFERICLRYPLEARMGKERYDLAEKEHRELLRAIKEMDTEQALSTLQVHFQGVRFYLFRSIELSRSASEESFPRPIATGFQIEGV
jgi:DNA-binding GntR family transcriptional regulator